jgi:hypothetical protein
MGSPPDMMHQSDQGVFKTLMEWLKELIIASFPPAEANARILELDR